MKMKQNSDAFVWRSHDRLVQLPLAVNEPLSEDYLP